MATRTKARGLIYLRRSGDRQETSLRTQLEWGLAEAQRCGVAVDAQLDDLDYMQSHRLHEYKSIRLDDAITGAELDRPGLNSLVEDARADNGISHIFVYKRDRLGRPDSPVSMMVIEEGLLRSGITLVRSDGVAEPIAAGDSNIAELVRMMFDYHTSGEFLRQLSERIIRTQLQLAAAGYWTGGNPPYGFVRALVDARSRRG